MSQIKAARELGEVNPCELCGGRVDHLWHVPEGIWARISPRPHTMGTDDGGIICVSCASRQAKKVGFTLIFHGWEILNQIDTRVVDERDRLLGIVERLGAMETIYESQDRQSLARYEAPGWPDGLCDLIEEARELTDG